MSRSLLHMFSSKRSIILGLRFTSLIYSELIFVDSITVSLLYMWLSTCTIWTFSQHHWVKTLSFLHCILFLLCQKLIDHIQVYTSWFLGSLFYSIDLCVFLCQYYPVSITVALYYNLKSGSILPPALLFFLKIALAVGVLLWFPTKVRIFFLSLWKIPLGFW